ncbi:amidohydrolase family protein [Paraliomyxa miuraensis]|uniref:amidohydrolase family protein n=1 Tax=Paraliomyxa miuraensis TaxID=376150 RepID=UPI002252F64D|nr:amidohydrolase family protein [Paraliomyxa miuraensis]MCX4244757.1 amidohydrolase family protein [Paraliomyxa miuraensis]
MSDASRMHGPIVVGPDATGLVVLVEGDRVRAVTEAEAPADVPRLACEGATIQRGRVNAHTHIYSGLAPLGLPAPEPAPQTFVQILERVWWRLDRALDEASLRASARLYVAQALLAGTTTLIDHHESPAFIEGSLDVLAAACDELGIRALLCYGATERNGGREEGRRGLAECRRFLVRSHGPRLCGAVALHASFTVSDDIIGEAASLCRELSTIMHVHVAEDGKDLADALDARARGYDGPLERLLALQALPPGSILAHGLDLDEHQVRRVHDAGCWIVQNPRSNHGNGVGYPRALAHGDRVALGTDGYPARMEDEDAALWEHARAQGDDLAAVAGRIAAGHVLASERFGGTFSMPSIGGGPVVADLRVVETDGRVRHVLVGGRVVVRNGELTGADLEEILRDARAQAERLWDRMAALAPSV